MHIRDQIPNAGCDRGEGVSDFLGHGMEGYTWHFLSKMCMYTGYRVLTPWQPCKAAYVQPHTHIVKPPTFPITIVSCSLMVSYIRRYLEGLDRLSLLFALSL